MPTIIDELIVSLKLDPRLFNQGQQQAVQSLQNLQATAAQTSTNIQRGPFSRMRQWWTNAFQPVTAAQSTLVNIGTQSRRTGLQVQAGAKTGQYSLLAMAAAGTAAYTAIKSVQEAFKAVTSTIAGTAAQGNLAGRLGVSPNWLSRLQVAGRRSPALVPAEETSGSLQSLVNFFTGIGYGEVDQERIRALGMMGVSINKKEGESQQDFIQRILEESADKLAEIRRTKGQAEAQRLGEMAGYTPRFAQFLSGGSAALRRGQEDAGTVATTDKMAKSAGELEQAIAKVATAWEGLIQKLQTAHPELTQIVNQFAKWLEDVQNSPEALDKLGAAATLVIGGTLVAMVGKFVQAVVAGNAVFLKTPLGMMIAGALGLYTLFENLPEGSQEKKNWEKLRRDPSDLSSGPMRGLSPGYRGQGPTGRMPGDAAYAPISGESSADSRTWWQRVAPTWLGGKAAPGGGGAGGVSNQGRGGPGRLSYGEMKQFALEAGFTGAAADRIAAIAMTESSGNIYAHNPKYPDDSYGITQINALAHGAVAKEAYGNPLRAMQLAYRISKGGRDFTPWTTYTSGAYRQFYSPGAAPMRSGSSSNLADWEADQLRRFGPKPLTQRLPSGKLVSEDDFPYPYLTARSAVNAASAANLRAGGALRSTGDTTNHNYGDVPISRIEVHTQATDALGIGGAIGNAVKNSLQTAQANTGLE